MRIKFDKEYLKYYTYAVLGVITMILFYKILDNLGFILSGTTYAVGAVFELLRPVLFDVVLILFLFRPMVWIEKQVLNRLKELWKNQNVSDDGRFWLLMPSS